MNKKTISGFMAAVLLISVLLAVAIPSQVYASASNTNVVAESDNLAGTVTASSLNIRSGPGTNNSTIGSLKKGAAVTITKKDYAKGWHQISYNGKAGYVSADYIKFTSGAAAPSPDSSTTGTDNLTGTVTASSLNVRSGPGTTYSTKGSLKKGATVTVTKKDYAKGWHQISYNGKAGYVSADYIKLAAGSVPPPSDPGTATPSPDPGTGTDNLAGTVTASTLNVRSGPGTNYSTMGSLKNGTAVTVTKKDYAKGWHQISYNSKAGYVSADYIKFTADSNNNASVQVQVSLIANKLSIAQGQNFRIFSTVTPSNLSNKSLTWNTSDPNIATVSSDGRVTGISDGTVEISATSAADPNVSAKCTVYVGNQSVTLSGYKAPPTQHFQGSSFSIKGTVSSQSPLTLVNLKVCDGNGTPQIDVSTNWAAGAGPTSYALTGVTNSIDSRAKFGTLGLGYREIQITCVNSDGVTISLADSVFEVITPNASTWYKLTDAQFSSQSTIDNVKKYFNGDDYLFTYKFDKVGGRDITIQSPFPSYMVSSYIPNNPSGGNKTIWVNKNMKKQYEDALDYAKNSIVSVQYNDGQTRTASLDSLILCQSGDAAYVPRFQSGLTYISIHSFGLAVDINNQLSPNGQTAANYPKIDAAIKNLSTAVVSDDPSGKKVYSFTYNGPQPSSNRVVPDELMNFMLYQIAFERYGFYWGAYFSSCDAMHFTAAETTATPAEHIKVTDFRVMSSQARGMLSAPKPEVILSGENYDLP